MSNDTLAIILAVVVGIGPGLLKFGLIMWIALKFIRYLNENNTN